MLRTFVTSLNAENLHLILKLRKNVNVIRHYTFYIKNVITCNVIYNCRRIQANYKFAKTKYMMWYSKVIEILLCLGIRADRWARDHERKTREADTVVGAGCATEESLENYASIGFTNGARSFLNSHRITLTWQVQHCAAGNELTTCIPELKTLFIPQVYTYLR